jgi:molybdopterin-binding protein
MNTLPATLTAITSSEHLSILTASIGEDHFHLLLAEQYHDEIGTPLTLAFKETEVLLFSSFAYTTANMHRALIETLKRGIILTHVTLFYYQTIISALVPTVTFDALDINAGDEIYWLVSPSEISLLRETHGI